MTDNPIVLKVYETANSWRVYRNCIIESLLRRDSFRGEKKTGSKVKLFPSDLSIKVCIFYKSSLPPTHPNPSHCCHALLEKINNFQCWNLRKDKIWIVESVNKRNMIWTPMALSMLINHQSQSILEDTSLWFLEQSVISTNSIRTWMVGTTCLQQPEPQNAWASV